MIGARDAAELATTPGAPTSGWGTPASPRSSPPASRPAARRRRGRERCGFARGHRVICARVRTARGRALAPTTWGDAPDLGLVDDRAAPRPGEVRHPAPPAPGCRRCPTSSRSTRPHRGVPGPPPSRLLGPAGAPPFGMVDVPSEQRRDVATFDITTGGHLGLYRSAPRSGRSTALRAMAGSLARWPAPRRPRLRRRLRQQRPPPAGGSAPLRRRRDPRPADRLSRLLGPAAGGDGRAPANSCRAGRRRPHRAAGAAGHRRTGCRTWCVLLDPWEGFTHAFDALDSGDLVAGGSGSPRKAPRSGSTWC